MFTRILLAVLIITQFSMASAHEVHNDHLRVAHPFATPTPPGVVNGAAYLDITAYANPLILIGASTPVSRSVELHDMRMEDDMMTMRHAKEIAIAAEETLTMRPGGGYHLMLLGLHQPLVEGEQFSLTLEFAGHSAVEVDVWVQSPEGSEAADDHHPH